MPTDEMNPPQDRQVSSQSLWREWLPTFAQIRAAAELKLDRAIDGVPIEIGEPDHSPTVDSGESVDDNSESNVDTGINTETDTDADTEVDIDADVATVPVDPVDEIDVVDVGSVDIDSVNIDTAAAEGSRNVSSDELPATSMREGMGLVFVVGLLAGLIPFLMNWYMATMAGTSVALAGLAQQMTMPDQVVQDLFPVLNVWLDTAGTIAGLEPIAPGWVAAFLSALGSWINWPLNWLASWIVYGLGVLAVAKLLGAPTTLQRFYAGVSYAFLPLLLLGLAPFPCVGAIASLAAGIWSLVIYVLAVRVVTGFDMLRSFVSVIAPVLIVMLVGLLVVGAGIGSIVGLVW